MSKSGLAVAKKAATLVRRPPPEPAQQAAEHQMSPSPMTALQASGGNRAASRLAKGGGAPLPSPVQQEMESRFGESFAEVRIHDDAQSHASAASMNAKAYTHGSDIVFSAQRFSPHSGPGKRLLAHELAHVVQQRRGGTASPAASHNEQAADAAGQQAASGAGAIAVQGSSAVGVACAPDNAAAPAPAQPAAAPLQYEYVGPDGKKVVLSADEFKQAKQRAINSVRSDLNLIDGLADNGRQTQHNLLDEYHGNVESLTDVWHNPKSLVGIAVDMRSGVTKPYIGMWGAPKGAINAGLAALDSGDLREAARMLSLAQSHYKHAQAEWNAYLDAIQQGGGKLIGELEVVRDVSFAISIAAGAAIAAPVVAAGAAGVGLTGAGAVAATALGTGGVVAVGGAGLRGTAAAAGSYATDGKVDRNAVDKEIQRGAKEGFVTGMTAGLGTGLGSALGVTAPGASALTRIGGGALVGGTANATGAMVTSAMDGKGAGDVLKAGAIGFGTGAVGSGLGGAVKGPLASKLVSTAVGAGGGAAGTYLSGGTKDEIIASAAIGAATALALSGAKAPSTSSQRAAFNAGRRVRNTVRAGAAATMMGLAEAAPATTLSTGTSSSVSAPVGSRRAAAVGQSTTTPATKPSVKASVKPTLKPTVRPSVSTATQAQATPRAAPAAAAATAAKPAAKPPMEGYRPAPGERTKTRAQWKKQDGADRWKKAVDAAFAQMDAKEPAEAVGVPRVKGGVSNPRIEKKAVPDNRNRRLDMQDIPRRPGENQRGALARVRTVIGTKLSDHPFLEKLWNDARASVLSREALTKSNYPDLYEKTRNAFWRRVRGNTPEASQARQMLDDAGFALAGGKGQRANAPELDGVDPAIPKTERTISLDHIEEKGQGNGWQKALDANNLQMEFAMPNTEREIKQMRHQELR